MKPNMLDYTPEEISQYSDDRLQAEWEDYLGFSHQRQHLREQVQRTLRKKSQPQSVKSTDLVEGGMATMKLGSREILVAKIAGKLYAIDNACGHSGYPLNQGCLEGYIVTCRWHNAKFDVRSGEVIAVGADIKPVRRFRVMESNEHTVKVGEEL